MIRIEQKWDRELYRTTKHENNGIENCIEPLSMKTLSVLLLINAQVPSDRQLLKADPRSKSSESSRKFTKYAPSYASSLFFFFFCMTMFCKQKEFNSKIILYLYLNTILDIMLQTA